ncbi:ABC-three component system middle component 5 [Pseudomonas fluorescens]|uniref:Uncharacterized protein n=1 Tax=Pseudomonas fluorescens TaxID=294 RepID=A0A5E7AIV2_PSEFL|nr:ABC-three component system middle component 5 [Pseudomonas fluorescens]VVN79432.1 hypothetical protein PS691_00971 [Pseudomonas fluorescens]
MLIYHPAYDINHSIYRILLILNSSIHKEFQWDLLRLMDFYVLFPHLLKQVAPLPVTLRSYKKLINALPDAYESMLNTKRILFELEPIQNTAIQNILAKDLIDLEKFQEGIVARSETALPGELMARLMSDETVSEEWFRFIANELPVLEFNGKSGLKSRSGLMEYKYDT